MMYYIGCVIRVLGTVVKFFNRNVFLSTILDFLIITDG
jgi:hypothetical protein